MRNAAVVLVALIGTATPAFAQSGKDEPKDPKNAPKTDEATLKEKLASLKVTYNFNETSFGEAVQFFQDFTGLNYVLDPLASDVVDNQGTKLTLKEKGTLAKDALDNMCAKAGLVYEVWKGTVWITTKAGVGRKPPAGKFDAATTKKLDTKLNLNFDETPLQDVLETLKDLTKVSFLSSKAIDASQVKVTLRVKDLKLGDAIAVLCRLTGFKAESKNESVVLSPRDDEAKGEKDDKDDKKGEKDDKKDDKK